jgi:CheY-like chemotaxis protein
VVDSDPSVLVLIAGMLAQLDCDAVMVRTETAALAILRSDVRIDLLMADVNLPGLGGYGLAELAKRLRPELQIALLSARDTDGHGLPVLRKPFQQSDLARVISQTTGPCHSE